MNEFIGDSLPLTRAAFIGVTLAAIWLWAPCNAEADDTFIVKGQCSPESHIAEGTIGEDLTKLQSRFFCDAAVISHFSDNRKHVIVQFAESESSHARQLGFAGMMDDGEIMKVRSVYLEPGQSSPVTEGYCKFFFKEKQISGIACGAKLDEAGRRTVPVVAFDAAPSRPPRSTTPGAVSSVPYDKRGVANCSLPGTIIEFALDGRGGAQVTRIDTNYSPFRRAVQQARVWQAGFIDKDGTQTPVFDNGHRAWSFPNGLVASSSTRRRSPHREHHR